MAGRLEGRCIRKGAWICEVTVDIQFSRSFRKGFFQCCGLPARTPFQAVKLGNRGFFQCCGHTSAQPCTVRGGGAENSLLVLRRLIGAEAGEGKRLVQLLYPRPGFGGSPSPSILLAQTLAQTLKP